MAERKSRYDPERAKAYRQRLMSYAIAGGYTPRKRTGTGRAIRKISATGNKYYYIPWDRLTEEEKEKRREYQRRIRELARKAKELGITA